MMKSLLSATLLLVTALLTSAAPAPTDFGGARYITQPDAKHTKSTKGTLNLDENTNQLSFREKDQPLFVVSYSDITSMRVEQSLNRLRVPFSHKVQHQEFLTIEYRTAEDKRRFAIFQLNDKSYREVVAALEAQSRKPIAWKAD
jgi:hypothetical protein